MNVVEFEGLSKAQAQKFKAYLENEYRTLYPPPKLKIVGLDWKFYGLVITSISTVVVAALRTAAMFYFAEVLSAKYWNPEMDSVWLGRTGAVFSMLAFEGGLALIAAIKTSESRKVDDGVYFWYISLLILISIMAGLGQSVGLIQGISDQVLIFFSYSLALVVGVGASVAAWLSGEILGVQLQKFSEASTEANRIFSEENRIYMTNARKFWKQRTELNKAEEKEQKLLEREQRREQNSPELPRNLPKNFSPRTSVRRTENGTSEKVSLILTELENHRTEHGKLLGFAELLENLRTKYPEQNFSSGGYVSTQRNKWIKEHPHYFELSDPDPVS